MSVSCGACQSGHRTGKEEREGGKWSIGGKKVPTFQRERDVEHVSGSVEKYLHQSINII